MLDHDSNDQQTYRKVKCSWNTLRLAADYINHYLVLCDREVYIW